MGVECVYAAFVALREGRAPVNRCREVPLPLPLPSPPPSPPLPPPPVNARHSHKRLIEKRREGAVDLLLTKGKEGGEGIITRIEEEEE